MRTNISSLMSMISEKEREFKNLISVIRGHVYSTSIQELSGTVNVIDDFKEVFDVELKEQKEILTTLSKLKAALYEKNNEFKLSDGRTIQQAIVDNSNLRQMKSNYDYMLNFRDTKKRFVLS